jgi:O-antigen/teichoic acid export membrane protein
MMLIVAMYQFAWQPFLLTNAKEKNAKEIFSKVLTLFLIGASSIWIFITLFVDNLIRFNIFGFTFFGKDYQQGWEIVSVILLAYLFHGMYVNFTAGVYIEDKNKFLPFITGAGALLNVGVNILLIPVMGIMGAAIATLAAYMLMAGLIFILAQKYFHIEYEFKKILTILALVLAACSAYYLLYYNAMLNIYSKLIILASFYILLFGFKVVRKQEIVVTIKALLRKG